ncbi:hypothetical protein KSC_110660 [Ktedonobacter sp. SOSP1-52]|uniref:DUF2721 domain-containing protein n=1 Tax=Ktedonobacter sp. SOSP1-52 TaxID=2778366 RepID=UPI0019152684|nr:DUF2721 domain-containing protein [Ktedonobacter sp. SOSP1-52]GHO72174.1 hypothetical protein KSC_110660 [Ktedonobacter sp. SOSP1-52]
MTIETMIHIISLILIPAVIISGCALVFNGLLQRYESIGGRLRRMHEELLDLLRTLEQDQTEHSASSLRISQVRRVEIEEQIPRLMRRYTLIRNALLLVEMAVITFVVDMFAVALAELFPSVVFLVTAPLVGFLLGVTFLLISLVLSILEIFHSHREVAYEATQGLHLSQSEPR